MPLLLDNIWLQFLKQVALENQKYPEASEHPSAYSLAYIKNVKLAGVHPAEAFCSQTNGEYISGFTDWGTEKSPWKTNSVRDIVCASGQAVPNSTLLLGTISV